GAGEAGPPGEVRLGIDPRLTEEVRRHQPPRRRGLAPEREAPTGEDAQVRNLGDGLQAGLRVGDEDAAELRVDSRVAARYAASASSRCVNSAGSWSGIALMRSGGRSPASASPVPHAATSSSGTNSSARMRDNGVSRLWGRTRTGGRAHPRGTLRAHG